MSLDKKRWIILGASSLISLCLGSIYSWSVYASAMAEYLSALLHQEITAGDLAIVFTITNAVGPVAMITGGWANDKFGPKKVLLVGGSMFCAGMFFSGFSQSITALVITYGLVLGLGLGLSYGSTIGTCIKFFPDRRGLAGGLTTGAYGLSSVILPPVITSIVARYSAPFAFKAIGLVFAVIILGGALVIQTCPKDYVPAGMQKRGGSNVQDGSMSWKQMLSTPVFYVMLLLLACGAFSGNMIISQASSIAQNKTGMTVYAAAIAVSVLALFNAGGRFLAGSVSDRIGRINTLVIAYVLSIAGLAVLYMAQVGSYAALYIGVSIIGLCFGSFMGVFPGFTADRFGVKHNSLNYGIMFVGFSMAGFFGPIIMQSLFRQTGSYQPALLIACVMNALGILLTFLYRVCIRQARKPQPALTAD